MLDFLRRLFGSAEGSAPRLPKYRGPKCPFYGFVGTGPLLMESRGPQCGLAGEHRRCQMFLNDEEPNWNNCPYNCEENAADITERLDTVHVNARILRPPEASAWRGVLLGDWFKYVMGRPYP